MFDGEIICRSRLGFGTNFIFIVALDGGIDEQENDQGITRIMNPIKKKFQKIKIPDDGQKQLNKEKSAELNIGY